MPEPAGSRPKFFFVLGALFIILFAFLLSGPRVHSEEAVTNEKLYELLGARAHNVSKDQLARLRRIMEGFLTGDAQSIARALDQMKYDISRMASKFPAAPGVEIAEVDAVKRIDKESELLRIAAVGGDYETAYKHFTMIAMECIQCHEARRNWGVFEKKAEAWQTARSRKAASSVVRTASATDENA